MDALGWLVIASIVETACVVALFVAVLRLIDSINGLDAAITQQMQMGQNTLLKVTEIGARIPND